MMAVSSIFGGTDLFRNSHSAFVEDYSTPQSFANGPRFPMATPLSFSSFNNKFQGSACYVVGRGPTTFQYEKLGDFSEPIFFINDAVSLEKYATSDTFFFAHDQRMRVWLDGSMRSTAVLPIEGTILGDDPGVVFGHGGGIVHYHRGEKDLGELLRMSRNEVAQREELFVHTGTIHSLVHFIWFCGFGQIKYIGCDGINHLRALAQSCETPDGYDRRLQNRSGTSPWWQYRSIRRVQDWMTTLFGIEATYIGTPSCAGRLAA